jgi:hypothetical protein
MDVRETNRRVIEQFRAGGPVEGMHRDRETWAMLTDTYPFFADHETRTERTIPVVALRRS